eukprot:TRINITY_DN9529_c0_g1_i1.p1 TRINITY_DN9529_c0_g1~~TRINITY_DN9529_c0_g1_i1.p1  ORF type:complete len:518 (+),score=143.63 TRINITY_DN9529_c0_g1_i1:52-1554(+)
MAATRYGAIADAQSEHTQRRVRPAAAVALSVAAAAGALMAMSGTRDRPPAADIAAGSQAGTLQLFRTAARIVDTPARAATPHRRPRWLRPEGKTAAGPGDVVLTMLAAETYATVGIGTPAAQLRVMVDTGSSTLIVPGAQCTNCKLRCPGCVYNSSASTSAVEYSCSSPQCQRIWAVANPCVENALVAAHRPACVASIRYADKSSLLFRVASDVLQAGGYSARVMLGSMEEESSHFASADVDGIWGLARRQLNFRAAHFQTPLARLAAASGTQDMFGVYVGDQRYPGSGALTLGHVDSRLYRGSLHWLAEADVDLGFYAVRALSLRAGAEVVATGGFGHTILDTGTTVIALPAPAFQALRRLLQPQLPAYADLWKGFCMTGVDVQAWPPLVWSFANASGGVTVASVPPDVYLLRATGPSGQEFRCLGIQPSPMPQLTILGDAWLGGFYAVFDRAHGRVGLAPAVVHGTTRRGVYVRNSGARRAASAVWAAAGLLLLLTAF